MHNRNRLKKIIDSGDLENTHINLLQKMHEAGRIFRRKTFLNLLPIVILLFSAVLFFGYSSFRYKRLLYQAQSLKTDIQEVDSQIASIHHNPYISDNELKKLVQELHTKQESYSDLREKLHENDYASFYSTDLERRIYDILMRFGENEYVIPQEMIQKVGHYVDAYNGRLRKTMERYLKQKENFFPMIHNVFRKRNIPPELAYVSMAESGFDTEALSPAGAKGLWQFMEKTAVDFGLEVNTLVDERLDPEKSTAAAAEYFSDLLAIFGSKSSVMLSMAAYNAGEGRIIGALRKVEDPVRQRDFWYLYRMGWLPDETCEYIPRILALMIISEYPKEYGF
ncbi:MAG: lytic transglycosylase domain-containing protein [Chitinispirillaceae bacterium]